MITSINIWIKSLITQKIPREQKFILSIYLLLISLSGSYQVDLRGTNFGELIGFEKKLLTKTEYGTKLPNITNSVD